MSEIQPGDDFPGLRILANQIAAKHLGNDLPPDVGFFLVLVHKGVDDGGMAYVSNLERDGTVATLIEFIDRAVLRADGLFQRKVRDAIDDALAIEDALAKERGATTTQKRE